MKLKNQMKIAMILAMCAAVYLLANHEYYKHKTTPEGYCVVQDATGRYFIQQHQSWGTVTFVYSGSVFTSRQAAINHAWVMSEWDKHPISNEEIQPQGEIKVIVCHE